MSQKDEPKRTAAMREARAFAKQGDEVWTHIHLERAKEFGTVSEQQEQELLTTLRKAQQRRSK